MPTFTKIVYITKTDKEGKCTFELVWLRDGKEKGQFFRGNPVEKGYPKPEDAWTKAGLKYFDVPFVYECEYIKPSLPQSFTPKEIEELWETMEM